MISFLAELCHCKFYNLFWSQCKIFIVSKTDQLKLYKTGADKTRFDPKKQVKVGKSIMPDVFDVLMFYFEIRHIWEQQYFGSYI